MKKSLVTLNAESSCFAIIPAAGSGRRFGSDVPKQYLPLLGKPVIRHTLERLHQVPWIRGIVLVHSTDDEFINPELLADLPKVTTTTGGNARAVSVLNGLWALDGAAENDWVLVHDAVRPCIRESDITALHAGVIDAGAAAGILATPVRETIKQTDTDDMIMQTVDRTGLWLAATPQMSRAGILEQSLQKTLGNPAITDEASALELQGIAVKIIQGRSDNIKITWPQDLKLAAAIMNSQKSEPK